jgi:protein SCO1
MRDHANLARHEPRPPRHIGLRALGVLVLGLFLGFASPAVAATWHNIDIGGSAPPLAFAMTDANTGREVTAAHFRGKVTLLYLGYTNCPDVCPLTLQHVSTILHRLGKAAAQLRVLFVTVDPNRDTLAVLRRYTALFAPQVVGLRGTPNELAQLARRYRLAYSVSPATASHPYEVTHSSALYVFDRSGRARLLIPSLANANPDIAGTAADLERLLQGGEPGWFARLVEWL